MISKIYFPRWISDWHITVKLCGYFQGSTNRQIREPTGLNRSKIFKKFVGPIQDFLLFFGPGSSKSEQCSREPTGFGPCISGLKIILRWKFWSDFFDRKDYFLGSMSAKLWFECICTGLHMYRLQIIIIHDLCFFLIIYS